MFGRQKVEDLTVEELEQALLIKRRQARVARFQRLAGKGRSPSQILVGRPDQPVKAPPSSTSIKQRLMRSLIKSEPASPPVELTRPRKLMNSALFGLEIVSIVGLVAVLVASYFNLRELNDEVAVAQQKALLPAAAPAAEQPAPAVALARLPGGHTPPTAPGGAVPDVPLHLQQWIQAGRDPTTAAIPIEARAAPAPTRIVIPKINVDAPIVTGVGWEDLKKGVGHLPGSAHPGERGNLYLAAHNDIYGEIFRYLEELEPGDEYFIYGGEQKFHYIVKEKRVIEPTEVEVMLPTTEPVATLQTCHPYLIDTHRLVVIGELAE